ncbi:MAG: insulinase family protein, partial [Saprospiraceae bacterium]|nr:insulinase family protein [Saprospiraceae bacterium]
LIQRFCKIPKTENARKREDYKIPRHQETLFAICSDPEASFTIAQLIYKLPEQPLKTLGNYKAQLARSLYNRMLGARLFELQQQPNPPFTFASSGYGSDIGDMDSYLVHVFTAEGKSIEGLRSILLETRRAQLHGFTATELERQKLEILKSAESAYRERDKMQSATLASRFVYHYLNESPVLDAEQYWKICQELLPLIKLEDINPLPKQWLGKENRVFVVTAPQKEGVSLPTEAALKALLDEIDRATPPPFVDNVSDEPLLAADFTSVEIIEQTEYQELGVTELKLANGVKVVLKPTDFKNDEISLSAFSPGGHSLYEDKDYMNATNASQIVDFSGIGKLDAVALQKKLAGKQLSISPYIGELEEGFSGYASPEDFETLLQLIYLYFTEPRRDSVVMQSLITRQRSVYQNMMQNPYYYFNEERSKIKYNGHSRRLMTKAEDLDNITLDGVYRIFRERFADASDFTFVLVGNIDIEKIKPLLTKYLGNLPSIQRKETWRDINADLTPGRIDTTIVRGQAPKAIVELTWHGAFDFNNRNARYHFSSMLELLRIKLRESLREEQGGVYGVRVSGTASKIPKEDYFITISFQCEPGQTDSLIQAAYTEIKQIQANGAAEKDLQKIRETQKQTRLKSLKENGFWSGQIALRYQYGLPLDGILYEEYEKIVDQLDSQSIKNAANLYFEETNFMKIVLLPEK